MSGLRRSSRAKTSTINVKLNEQNEIEYYETDDHTKDEETLDVVYEENGENEEEEEEEVIVNEDGTMSIKINDLDRKRKTVQIQHICSKCSKVYATLAALKRHLNLCKNLPKDVAPTPNEDEFDFQSINVNDPIYETICFCCNEEKETAHYGHVSCNFCPKSFKSHTNLERHLFLLHSADKRFPCISCNATCASDDVREVHMDSHETGKPFSCSFCGKDFTRKYHLDRHLLYTSCDKTRKKTEVACHVCGKLFSRTDNLREHLRAHIGQSTRKRDYQCPHCDKSFYGSSLLNIHIRTHTGEKPFFCDLCEKSFPSNGALRKHRRSHTGEKPYTCKTCGKCFSAKETLNRHNKTHTGERPYVCEYCNKSFIQATQLRSHLFHHTGENAFTCDYCNVKFNRKNRLENHIKNMHLKVNVKQEKEFKCKTCKKCFKSAVTLKVHQKTHAIQPLKCNKCDKQFKQTSGLMRHMKAKHDESGNISIEKQIEIDDDTMLTVIKEDPLGPDTYKIICGEDDPTTLDPNYAIEGTVGQVFEIYEYQAADEMNGNESEEMPLFMDDEDLKTNIARLLNIVVDDDVLTKFGFPNASVEKVLSSVIKQCGQRPVDSVNCPDPSSRLRENVKLLFTTVIDDETTKEMLNNHTVDEVVSHVIKISEDE